MACALQATLAANAYVFSSRRFSLKLQKNSKRRFSLFTVRADSDDSDCNEEECAPDKEVSFLNQFGDCGVFCSTLFCLLCLFGGWENEAKYDKGKMGVHKNIVIMKIEK